MNVDFVHYEGGVRCMLECTNITEGRARRMFVLGHCSNAMASVIVHPKLQARGMSIKMSSSKALMSHC